MRIGKSLALLIVAILAACALGGIGYLVYKLTSSRDGAPLLWAYLCIGVIHAISNYLLELLPRLRYPNSANAAIHVANIAAVRDRGLFYALRMRVAFAIRTIAMSLNWPSTGIVSAVVGFRDARRGPIPAVGSLPMKARLSLFSLEPVASVGSVILLMAVWLIEALRSQPSYYAAIFVGCMLLHVGGRRAASAIDPVSLPAKLKTLPLNAYALFMLVLLCDYLALVTGFAELKSNFSEPTLTILSAITTELFGFRRIADIYRMRASLTTLDVAILTCGVLYYLTLVTSALRFRDFARSDADVSVIAARFNQSGRFTKALEWLRHVKIKTVASETERVIALVGLNQIDDAWPIAMSLAPLQGQSASPDAAFATLAPAVAVAPAPSNARLALIQKARKEHVSDGRLLTLVQTILNEGSSATMIATALSDAEHDYPLTMSVLAASKGDMPEALRLLDLSRPAVEYEEAWRKIIFAAVISDPTLSVVTPTALDDWFSRDYGIVVDLIKSIHEPWQLFHLYTTLYGLRAAAVNSAPTYVEQVEFLRQLLRDKMETVPASLLEAVDALAARRLARSATVS
jgi:hypothetical protein